MSLLRGAFCSSSICSTPRRTRSISAWSSARARSAEAEIDSSPGWLPGSSGKSVTKPHRRRGGGRKTAPLRRDRKNPSPPSNFPVSRLGLQQVEAVAADRQLVCGVEDGDVDLAVV